MANKFTPICTIDIGGAWIHRLINHLVAALADEHWSHNYFSKLGIVYSAFLSPDLKELFFRHINRFEAKKM